MKKHIAAVLALLFMLVGMLATTVYFTETNNSWLQILALLLSAIISFPAYTFWLETFRTWLNVK